MIKFKVWDSKLCEFWKDLSDSYIDSDGNLCDFNHGEIEITDKRFIPVFSTGQTDKNQAEIYEGDILNEFWGKSFIVEHIIEKGTENGGHGVSNKYYFSGYRFNYDHLEIIGNRYENPELVGTGFLNLDSLIDQDLEKCKKKQLETYVLTQNDLEKISQAGLKGAKAGNKLRIVLDGKIHPFKINTTF